MDGASTPLRLPGANDRLPSQDRPLLYLLQMLQARDYAFVTPTPSTVGRVSRRADKALARDLRDIFGWSRPFEPDLPPPEMVERLGAAGALKRVETGLQSRVRVSSLDGRLFLHSAYPTRAADAVFFGPDSYRFASFLEAEAEPAVSGVAVDIGTGAGVGAITTAALHPQARVIATDVNPKALRLARINAVHAGLGMEFRHASGLDGIEEPLDLVVANPPYIAGGGRTYSDGGGAIGAEISLHWARQACAKLAPGGRLLLYSGSAIVDGKDAMRAALERIAGEAGCALRYRELDPDVFGESLSKPPYCEVERIAAIGAVLTRR